MGLVWLVILRCVAFMVDARWIVWVPSLVVGGLWFCWLFGCWFAVCLMVCLYLVVGCSGGFGCLVVVLWSACWYFDFG